MNTLQIRRFEAADFPIYQSWFKDKWLNQALGPIDEEWLAYILQEQEGAQYAILQDLHIIAVIGVVFATPKQPFNIITDLAVNPSLRRKGIGKASLDLLLKHHQTKQYMEWRAFVDKNNEPALHFLQNAGWSLEAMDDMYQLKWMSG